ncbi:hypothetical protein ACLOJK_000121 [Asimina triloba]
MAFECRESQNSSPKLSDFSHNPWNEEVSPAQLKSSDCSGVLVIDSKEETRESIVAKPVSAVHREQGNRASGKLLVPIGDEYGEGSRRSITDLPSVLVSEIFQSLDAKELGIVSCVSTLLCKIASDHSGWKEFYCQRWGMPLGLPAPPPGVTEERSWKDLFVRREFSSKMFMGRYNIDVLYGHTDAVRSVFLLASAKLIFTGGYDSVVRMWDMEEGLGIASSRSLGCTIRAVTADTKLLVAGGTDGFLQCWRTVEGYPHLFDIAGFTNQNCEFRLWEHEGPVTCLALDIARIYSGSWDMSVRIWDRAQLECVRVLRHGDWVWSLTLCGSTVASSAGSDVYVWDIESGDQVGVIDKVHVGNTYAVACSHSGDLLFSGGEDGSIHMFEVSSRCMDDGIRSVATWIPHTGPVNALAFEFPWLVSSSGDGKLALIDVRKLLKSSRHRLSGGQDKVNQASNIFEPPQRMLHGFKPNLFSVDIGADRIVCGGEEGVVRIWNFSQALEIERRVQALRGMRLENRMRRRKVQIEMSSKGSRSDQCSAAARRNQLHGERSGAWHGRRGADGKLKA